MKKIASVIITLACTAPGAAWADAYDSDLPVDSRMKMLMYDETDVYTITTKYGFQTNIVFDKNEEIQTISVGDRTMWQIVPSSNRLFIRPMEDNASTNMTVLTSKHSYQFDLKSVAGDKDTGIVYVAKFTYPEKHRDAPAVMSAATSPVMETPSRPMATNTPAPPPVPLVEPTPAPEPMAQTPAPTANEPEHHAAPTNPVHKNERYSFSGPDNLAPLEVFDDGTSTYIKFPDMTKALPDPYVVDAHGLEKPVSYYVQDNRMVIDRVVGELEFKSASGNVSVYNELLDPR